MSEKTSKRMRGRETVERESLFNMEFINHFKRVYFNCFYLFTFNECCVANIIVITKKF